MNEFGANNKNSKRCPVCGRFLPVGATVHFACGNSKQIGHHEYPRGILAEIRYRIKTILGI